MENKKTRKYYALRTDDEICIRFLKRIFKERQDKEKILQEIDVDKLIKLRETNLSNKAIAMQFGISYKMMDKVIRDLKLPKRRKYK